MAENQVNYLKAILGFDAVVQRADPSRWDNAAPCEGWTARDVVNHMVFMAEMVKGMATGNPAAIKADDGIPAPGAPGRVMRPELVQILMKPVIGAGDDPAQVWAEHRDALLGAIANPAALDAESTSPWGHTTTDSFLPMAGGDAVVHSWDLATALGHEPAIEPELADAALRAWRDSEAAGSAVRRPGVLAASVPTTSEDPLTRLIAYMGRDPG